MNRFFSFKRCSLDFSSFRAIMLNNFKTSAESRLFYSNKHLQTFIQQKHATFAPNLKLLQSSISPFGKLTRSASRTYVKGNTWGNYNKYYGRSNWDRLRGPAIFTAVFCAGTTFAMPYLFDYTPLSVFKRRPHLLIYSIIAVNGAIFLMWKSPVFLRNLTRYGLLVKDNVYSNWSLLGAAFSHQNFFHILVNMFVLQSFGTSLCAMLGTANFLTMYLNSAVLSSFLSLLIPTLTRTSLAVGSLGASGAIFGVIGTFAYLFPKSPVALFFFPIPGGAWVAFLGTVAYNMAGLFFRWGSYDYAAHLGGSLAGIAYGWYYQKKRRERMSKVRYGF